MPGDLFALVIRRQDGAKKVRKGMKPPCYRIWWFLMLIAFGSSLAAPIQARDCTAHWWWPLYQRCPCCPDDYVRRPCPSVPPFVQCGAPDDYCPRPLPLPGPVRCGEPDDYCPRPMPIVSPCYPPWYTCGTESCAPAARR